MSGFKVLLVDDSKVSRMVAAGMLRQLRPDAEILEAGDGATALSLWKTQGAELAILDMNMPGLSGLEVAAEIRQADPNARLALLTANGQDSVRTRAAALAVPFFRKPVTVPTLSQILTELGALEGGRGC